MIAKENKDFDEFMNNDNRTIYKHYVRKIILRNDYVVFDYLRNGKYLTRLGYLTGNVMYINPPYNKNITRYKTLEDWANYKGIKVVHRTPVKTRINEELEKDYSKEIKLVEAIIGVYVESWDEDYSTGYIYHTERYREIEFYELIEVKVLEDEPHDHEINFEHLTSLDEYVKKYDYNNEYVEEDGYNEVKKELYAVEIGGKWYVY